MASGRFSSPGRLQLNFKPWGLTAAVAALRAVSLLAACDFKSGNRATLLHTHTLTHWDRAWCTCQARAVRWRRWQLPLLQMFPFTEPSSSYRIRQAATQTEKGRRVKEEVEKTRKRKCRARRLQVVITTAMWTVCCSVCLVHIHWLLRLIKLLFKYYLSLPCGRAPSSPWFIPPLCPCWKFLCLVLAFPVEKYDLYNNINNKSFLHAHSSINYAIKNYGNNYGNALAAGIKNDWNNCKMC